MNVLIRNVSEVTLEKIDVLAKKEGKSRQEFLKEQLEIIAVLDVMIEDQENVKFAIEDATDQLENNFKQLDKIEKRLGEMIQLVSFMTGIDPKYFDEIVHLQ